MKLLTKAEENMLCLDVSPFAGMVETVRGIMRCAMDTRVPEKLPHRYGPAPTAAMKIGRVRIDAVRDGSKCRWLTCAST